ncbi:MAG TPA: SGNH hydrolase domain-containing protein, partial [Brevundimonas sp.]
MLFGDSHAAQWFTPVAAFATSQDAVLTTVLKSSCPPAAVDVVSSRLRRIFTECLTWRVAALEQIRALHPDLVIISEHSLSYVRRPDFEVSAPSATPDEWRR